MSQLATRTENAVGVAPTASAATIAADLTHALHTRIASEGRATHPASSVRLLGSGMDGITKGLARVEPLAKRSVWGMQPIMRFDPDDPADELDERSARRGLSLQQLISEYALTVNPLLPSINPQIRVAPVAVPCILVDEAAAILAGPSDAMGRPTAWLVTDPSILELARAAWEMTWAASAPVSDRSGGAVSRRQLEVARGLVKGVKDAALARQLGVSPRTVVADVGRLLEHLGARSRAEAVFILGGGAALRRG